MLIRNGDLIYRVLSENGNRSLVIDFHKKTMPKWIDSLNGFVEASEDDLGVNFEEIDSLTPKAKKTMYERYTLISGVINLIANDNLRNEAIEEISIREKVSKQTIRRYLCLYLAFNDIRALAPVEKSKRDLSTDEKNMRYALNKFFYNKNKNNLKYAYRMMLKEKYCNEDGILKEDYPSFYQFRYFYRKTKNYQTYYISRNGLKRYQRDFRPLVGDNIQNFAPCIGTGMLDSTICDIYIVNEAKQIIGRPILTACIDAYSGLCNGYSLTLEGGIYSLKNLMLNVITDKKEHCKKFGINIDTKDWNSSQMPFRLVTDKGSEYKGENFEQLAELGITIVNLPSYRPELKGMVEKFFDVIQGYFKPYLKGKGLIEPDFQERGAHDYRKDAALTLRQFEAVIINCILFYNSKRIIERFPYTEEMLDLEIKPYASCIWNYGLTKTKLIKVDGKALVLALLPRTTARFTRLGLRVNKLRYHNENFREQYLQGKEVVVAYDPEKADLVYLIDNGKYIEFELIESRFKEKSLEEIYRLKEKQGEIVKREYENKLQAEIDLSDKIYSIRNQAVNDTKANIKKIREARKKEQYNAHRDFLQEVGINE